VVDFAAVWRAGDVRAGDDADAAAWVTQDQFDAYGVTPLVRSVVGKAQTLRDAASSGL